MAAFEDTVKASTKGKNPDVLSAVFLAVDRDGKKIIDQASGKTKLNGDAKAADKDTIFRLASCTKLITTVAALRLVQAGQIALDDAEIIKKHLPELYNLDVLTSAPGEPFTYEKRRNGITLRQLLTHSSGVGYDMIDPRLQAWRRERGERPLALSGPIVEAFSTPLLFEPGEGWAYGGGLDWVSLLISRISGQSFGNFLQKEVFDVTGCDDKIGFWEEDLVKVGDMGQIVTKTKDGNAFKKFPVQPAKAELGGGGLFSSSANFVKILQGLVSKKSKLLNEDMLKELWRPQFEAGSKSLQALRASAPVFASMTGALTSSLNPETLNYALGGILLTEDDAVLGKTSGTMSWGGAFNCLWFANREQGLAGFYGSSMYPPGERKSSELIGEFVKEVWRRVGEKEA
ncbi:beta-lactamase/transpeptidase-like protein [Lophiotrema nucula]|uniref:Beta-lactamase/transpeptidase-like protein n=1 Tax=Lophiotrema nucula TaxID=690887 RepID=A0A6A5YXD2_9PLEO|nr:beta-lactamase/transpeptidase-like protein [Lophiotrema nucula]